MTSISQPSSLRAFDGTSSRAPGTGWSPQSCGRRESSEGSVLRAALLADARLCDKIESVAVGDLIRKRRSFGPAVADTDTPRSLPETSSPGRVGERGRGDAREIRAAA